MTSRRLAPLRPLTSPQPEPERAGLAPDRCQSCLIPFSNHPVWCGQRAAKDPVTAADFNYQIQLCETETYMPTNFGDLASLVSNLQNRTTDGDCALELIFPAMRAIAKRRAPRDFARRDLIDDVVSRAIELVCRRPPGHFDPSRGSVNGYLEGIVRTAIRDVRDENQFTVTRRRDYQTSTPPEGERPLIQLRLPRPQPCYEIDSGIELLSELERRFERRPDLLSGSKSIAFEGQTVVAAAAEGRLTRFQLIRQVARVLDRDQLVA